MFKGTFSMKIWVENNSKGASVNVKPANVLGPNANKEETPSTPDTSSNT
jgi:hypothetical protein